MSNRAWVTLATNDSYGLGALVLAHSLRRAGSSYPAVVLITPSVTDAMRDRLRAVFADVVIVDVLDSRDAAHLALLQRPELGITFTKIHCWSLTQYEKCVFLDADTLVIQNCDELFDREELSAAPDVGWPDCFNSGVFVYKPSKETFEQLIKFAQERGSFDGGDQGLLNSFFSDWAHGDIKKHLPFLYNVTSAAFYSYLPALKHYGQNLKIIHFIGIAKPWLQQFNWESRTVDAPDHLRGLLQLWWDLFVGQVHPQLDVSMGEVHPPPALPPHDVGQHYMPTVDPESEFPWHHPDAQIQEDSKRPEIDLGEFHDPWEIYRGHIPSNPEEATSHATFSGRVEDHEDMKKYAWDYHPQGIETQHTNYEEQSTHQQFDNSYHDTQSYHHHHHQTVQHWETHSHSHDPSAHTHHHSHEQHWHQEHHQKHHEEQHHQQHFVHQHHENVQDYIDSAHSHHHHQQDHDDHSATGFDHHSHTHSHHSHHDHDHTPHEDYCTDVNSLKTSSNRVEIVHHVRLDHETILSLHKSKEDPDRPDEMMNGDITDSESDYYEEIRPRHPYDGFYLRHRPTIDANGRKICSHEVPPTPSPSPPPDLESDDGSPDSFPEETPVTDEVEEQSGVAGNLARVVPGALGSQREALDELTRRQGWEAGNIDYMGADSFDNIWAKISQTLSQPRASPPKQPSPPKELPKQEAPAPAPAPVEVAQEAVTVDAPVVEAEAAPAAEPPVEVKAVEAPAPVEAATEAPAQADAPVAEAPPKAEAAPAPAAQPEPVAAADIPATVEAAAKAPEAAPASVEPSEIPATVEAIAPGEAPQPANVPASVETAEVVKDEAKTETPALPPTPPVTPKSTPEATPVSESAPALEVVQKEEAPVEAAVAPSPVEAAAAPAPVAAPVVPTPVAAEVTPVVASEVPVEAKKEEVPAPVAAPEPVVETQKEAPVEAPKEPAPATPEKSSEAQSLSASTDSPPLANTPSKEEPSPLPAAKSTEEAAQETRL